METVIQMRTPLFKPKRDPRKVTLSEDDTKLYRLTNPVRVPELALAQNVMYRECAKIELRRQLRARYGHDINDAPPQTCYKRVDVSVLESVATCSFALG